MAKKKKIGPIIDTSVDVAIEIRIEKKLWRVRLFQNLADRHQLTEAATISLPILSEDFFEINVNQGDTLSALVSELAVEYNLCASLNTEGALYKVDVSTGDLVFTLKSR